MYRHARPLAVALTLLAGTALALADEQTKAGSQDKSNQNAANEAQIKGELSTAKTPDEKARAEQALENAAENAQRRTNGQPEKTGNAAQVDHKGTTPNELQRAEQAVPPEPTTNHEKTQPVLVDGKPAVPGAQPNPQTEPSKFSGTNDAVDKLNQNALTDKALSKEQRAAVYGKLRARETTGIASTSGSAGPDLAKVGVELPANVELLQLPADVAGEYPSISIYRFAHAGDKVLLVEPSNRVVVAVLEQ